MKHHRDPQDCDAEPRPKSAYHRRNDARLRSSLLAFCDETSVVAGTATERDIAISIAATERSSDMAVRNVMSASVVDCQLSDDVHIAEEL